MWGPHHVPKHVWLPCVYFEVGDRGAHIAVITPHPNSNAINTADHCSLRVPECSWHWLVRLFNFPAVETHRVQAWNVVLKCWMPHFCYTRLEESFLSLVTINKDFTDILLVLQTQVQNIIRKLQLAFILILSAQALLTTTFFHCSFFPILSQLLSFSTSP